MMQSLGIAPVCTVKARISIGHMDAESSLLETTNARLRLPVRSLSYTYLTVTHCKTQIQVRTDISNQD